MDVQSPAGQPHGTPAGRGTDRQPADAAAGSSPGGQAAGVPARQGTGGRPPSRGHAGIRHFRIWRGSADGGRLEDFHVEVNEGEVVLDVIHRLQATQAGDLAVRWNCKAGKCGSCSAEINGMPRLMCMTRMGIFAQDETVIVTPLRTFPVIKDLVTDVSFNYEKASEIPAFMPRPREADGTYRMAQVDVERSQEFRKCIECFLCQDTCHVIRDHEENKQSFSGPRFLIRLAELDMHPLDTNNRKRLSQEQAGLGLCNITKCCTEVCPEGIKITDNGIIPLKERVVDTRYDPLVWLGNKIRRRPA
jgi:succinate dehydrogenase / fumarate reductase iron-sulfur subunit